jgi:hypothetical protein
VFTILSLKLILNVNFSIFCDFKILIIWSYELRNHEPEYKNKGKYENKMVVEKNLYIKCIALL